LDGTPSSYYIRYSPTNSTKWVFYAEDGGANCILSAKLCSELIKNVPYFTTSDEKYHPQQRGAFTIFSDDPTSGPWPEANFIYMNYCSQDGWLGRFPTELYSGYYLRGSLIYQAILTQVLKTIDPTAHQLVLVGSSAGAIGVFNHLDWIVKTLHFPVQNLEVILDSFYAPITQVEPMKVRAERREGKISRPTDRPLVSGPHLEPALHHILYLSKYDLLGGWISLCRCL
jgi:hypothetical protein